MRSPEHMRELPAPGGFPRLGAWLLAGLLAGCAGGGLPSLIKALKNPNPDVRADAARKLGRMGADAKPAIPALTDALKDRHASVYLAAMETLSGFGEDARPGVTLLAMEPAAWLRCRGVEALGRLGPSPASVDPLMRGLADHDQCVRDKAVEALGRTGNPAVPALVGALKSPNLALRRGASEALGRMPEDARERAVFPLIQELRSSDDYARGEAEMLLGEMGAPAATSLVELLEDKDPDLRRRAVMILGRLEEGPDAVVAGLLGRLKDPDDIVRLKASLALGDLGERDPRILPALLLRLSSEHDPAFRRGLVDAVGNMGPSAKDAVDTLVGLLSSDPDAGVREEASESLMKIGTIEGMDAAERYNRKNLKD